MTLGECAIHDLVVVTWHHPGHADDLNGLDVHVLVTGRCGESGVFVERVDPETLAVIRDTWCAVGIGLEVLCVVERGAGRPLKQPRSNR